MTTLGTWKETAAGIVAGIAAAAGLIFSGVLLSAITCDSKVER